MKQQDRNDWTAPNSKNRWTAPDVMTVASAAYLLLSPWMFRYADVAVATRSAVLIGVLLAAITAAKIIQPRDWQDWANFALGIWAMIAPWQLGFDDVRNAAGMHIFAGLVAVIAAVQQLWVRHFDELA